MLTRLTTLPRVLFGRALIKIDGMMAACGHCYARPTVRQAAALLPRDVPEGGLNYWGYCRTCAQIPVIQKHMEALYKNMANAGLAATTPNWARELIRRASRGET